MKETEQERFLRLAEPRAERLTPELVADWITAYADPGYPPAMEITFTWNGHRYQGTVTRVDEEPKAGKP